LNVFPFFTKGFIFVEVEMSEESEIIDDYDAIVDVSDIDDVDTNVDDLNDVDQLLVTTKEESNKGLHSTINIV
jgi:hypothetical protein